MVAVCLNVAQAKLRRPKDRGVGTPAFGHSLWSAISYEHKWLTSCAGMTCHARRELFVPKLQYFLSFNEMHLYVTILITVLATCHAFVPDAVNVQETRGYGAYADQKGLLTDFLEKFREKMRKGDAKLGIPVLDPLKVNQLNLNIHEEELVS
ncbi:hypothetical protein E2986_12951 [Frieseomelitta varia]|uniref:Uncharacterized protein n=1 Tax=Frieseomelitta varia TaxID=561572 RepID=A0A833W715_9HYME|nr:hypothetical protein E2986_12951 [Frieseomelitta varia]